MCAPSSRAAQRRLALRSHTSKHNAVFFSLLLLLLISILFLIFSFRRFGPPHARARGNNSLNLSLCIFDYLRPFGDRRRLWQQQKTHTQRRTQPTHHTPLTCFSTHHSQVQRRRTTDLFVYNAQVHI